MYKITNVQTRPNTEVPFWNKDNPALTQEYLEYYRNTYIITGKQIDLSTTISTDGLIMTTTLIWDSEDSVNAWRADPIVREELIDKMKAYLDDTGITIERSGEAI
jgi:hypothetical protein